MQAIQGQQQGGYPRRFEVKAASFDDIKLALREGVRDLTKRPALSLFFGVVYAVLGAMLISGLLVFDQIWIVIAAGVGFPLVAPFLAIGLYEVSRRLRRGDAFTASDIFLVVFNQHRRDFGGMAFVVLFAFWMWAYQVRVLLAIFLQNHPIHSFDNLITAVFTTSDGAGFLMTGTVIGGIIATILFSITVISLPLLLDKDVDFITAIITSVKSVHKSPVVMLGWGATVGVMTFLAIAPALIGVIFVFPILGHSSWHLYERLVTENEPMGPGVVQPGQ